MEGSQDAMTVARVLAGDVDAYALLVSRYRDRCLRYASRMLGDLDDAEDVTQEAFVRAYRSLARCQDQARFGAWLFQILVNRCRTAAQRRGRRNRLFETGPLDPEMRANEHVSLSDRGTESTLEVREELDRALARLNDAQREAFLLKYVEEMTYEEIAALTGVNVSALKMRASRACDMLRESLAEVYHAQ
jgi:RNA polymerase sigma-70 factor (ECF subfamily)